RVTSQHLTFTDMLAVIHKPAYNLSPMKVTGMRRPNAQHVLDAAVSFSLHFGRHGRRASDVDRSAVLRVCRKLPQGAGSLNHGCTRIGRHEFHEFARIS